MDERERARAIILRRRASFVSASLAVLGCAASQPGESQPATTPTTPTTTPEPVPAPVPALSESASAAVPGSPAPSASASPPTPEPPAPSASAVAVVCLSVRIIQQVEFGHGANVPTPGGRRVLDAAYEVLQANPKARIALEGHTDKSEPPYGRKLGLERARYAARVLERRGIDPSRLCTVGFGDSRPLTPGKTAAQRARNRRVSFRLLGKDEPCP